MIGQVRLSLPSTPSMAPVDVMRRRYSGVQNLLTRYTILLLFPEIQINNCKEPSRPNNRIVDYWWTIGLLSWIRMSLRLNMRGNQYASLGYRFMNYWIVFYITPDAPRCRHTSRRRWLNQNESGPLPGCNLRCRQIVDKLAYIVLSTPESSCRHVATAKRYRLTSVIPNSTTFQSLAGRLPKV